MPRQARSRAAERGAGGGDILPLVTQVIKLDKKVNFFRV